MTKQTGPLSDVMLKNALALFQRGKFGEAEAMARDVLAGNPRHAPLLQFIGILCHSQHKHDEAVGLFAKAIKIDPRSGEGHYNLGNALASLGRHAEAVASFERSLALRPGNYDSLNNLGLALNALQRHGKAEMVLRQATAAAPRMPAAHFSLGLALEGQRRLPEAVECLKTALACGHTDPAAVYSNLARLFLLWDRSLAAIDCLQKALQAKPRELSIILSLAEAELRIGRFTDAARDFAAGLAIAPNDQRFLTGLLFARRNGADWSDQGKLRKQLAEQFGRGDVPDEPFRLLSLCDDPALHLEASRRFVARLAQVPKIAKAGGGKATAAKLRIAYLSGDFRHHAVSMLAAGLFEHHDRQRFETFAYSWGDDSSPLRRRLQQAFDHFIDVSATPDERVAAQMREAGIDIAVDLQGFTGRLRLGILAQRPAPIQVSYLGYPGTMGADWIDYIVADHFVIPGNERQHYSESVVCMPDCYLVNDDKRPHPGPAPERATLGLPEEGFVFACFNNTWKTTPEVFDVWMRLLERVPTSVLWLYCKEEDDKVPTIAQNFRREAGKRGIGAERLIFAPFAPFDEHVRRLQSADLFLDTLPYNAGSTASDALWAGLPLLTCTGRSFVARMAGSLLHAVGLPELVAATLEEYEAIAVRLATDAAAYTAVRSKLGSARTHAALFDTARFTKNLEAAYQAMWTRHREGKPPAHIDLAVGPANAKVIFG